MEQTRQSFWPNISVIRHRPLLDGWQYKLTYLLLQQIDLIMTMFAIPIGFSEMNPVMRHALASPLQMITLKTIVPLIVVLLIPPRWLIPAICVIAFVVMWDCRQLLALV
jgi:hypothetical protein